MHKKASRIKEKPLVGLKEKPLASEGGRLWNKGKGKNTGVLPAKQTQ